jgi:hypothetical protein
MFEGVIWCCVLRIMKLGVSSHEAHPFMSSWAKRNTHLQDVFEGPANSATSAKGRVCTENAHFSERARVSAPTVMPKLLKGWERLGHWD